MQLIQFFILRFTPVIVAALLILPANAALAQDLHHATIQPQLVDLDLTINYFYREMRSDGVILESRYQEKMLRRNNHVWTHRVIPESITNSKVQTSHEHKEFNYTVLPRLVKFNNGNTSVDYVDLHEHQLIHIPATEFNNVNFDGSWLNTYYLVNPKIVAAMPLSKRVSKIANAQWHETENKGIFQRVLWDYKSAIPLIIESGNQSGIFYQRVEVKNEAGLQTNLPWHKLQEFSQKEYSDFLD